MNEQAYLLHLCLVLVVEKMNKVKVSVVSYLNSKPFLYGLEHAAIKKSIDLSLDIPSVCAKKLVEGEVDLGLVPVAVLPKLKFYQIVSNYCIGADGEVGSVMLYSNVPLNEIKEILLDYQSLTSVSLVKVLAVFYWKINPQWISASVGFEENIKGSTAAVIIGDRTFSLKEKYKYSYDLAKEWQLFTGLPFVFACWATNIHLQDDFLTEFNDALKHGLDNRNELIDELNQSNSYPYIDIASYLNNSIKFDLATPQMEAMQLFLKYLSELEIAVPLAV